MVSLQLTQYALKTLRAQARDAAFASLVMLQQPISNNNSSGGGVGVGTTDGARSSQDSDTGTNPAGHQRQPQKTSAQLHKAYAPYVQQCEEKFPHQQQAQHAFDQELTRRRFALFLYLIRSPIFDR